MKDWRDMLRRQPSDGPGAPFAAHDVVQVVLPSRLDGVTERERTLLLGIGKLLEEHAEGLRLELGAPFRLTLEDPGRGPRWLIGPSACNPALERSGRGVPSYPVLHVDRAAGLLLSDAPSVDGIFESFSLLGNMHRDDSALLTSHDCASLSAAVCRIVAEVGCTWPSFERTGVSWQALCERYADAVLEAIDPVAVIERWLAELGDAHTGVRAVTPSMPPCFRARVEGSELVLHEVPVGSAAWQAGAREGHLLLGLTWEERWARTGAALHHKPLLVPLRLTSACPGERRRFSARSPQGDVVSWTEAYGASPSEAVVTWRRLPSGAGYLRVRQWAPSPENVAAIDAAFEALRGAPGLVVDLRGNGGGNVGMARAFRDRFVRSRQWMGYRQFSDPRGALGRKAPIFAEPAAAEKRWPGAVRFLTDPLTYSASEDLLLGLSGLDHVEVIGLETGGGSGQARRIRLEPGWRLLVSSCLTFDRQGRCIEGAGIPVDRRVPPTGSATPTWEAALLAAADRGW
jgi:carboxyl-terminal processing protease